MALERAVGTRDEGEDSLIHRSSVVLPLISVPLWGILVPVPLAYSVVSSKYGSMSSSPWARSWDRYMPVGLGSSTRSPSTP